MSDGRQINGGRSPSFSRGRQGKLPGADRRGATQRNRELSLADEQAIAAALARKPEELLDELRAAWDMPARRPVRVVGRLTLTRRGSDGADMVFLNELEHPETGVGLVYPTLGGLVINADPVNASVPPGPSREITDAKMLASGEQWAIAELELSSLEQRRKLRNPWVVTVRSGSLRLLSDLPNEWQIQVHGAQSVKRISASAREEIEDHVRNSVLEEDQELARRHAENERRLTELATTRRHA